VKRGDALVAPGDPAGVAVESLVAALRAEMVDQRSRDPSGAAPDVEHPLAGLEAADLDQNLEQPARDGGVVGAGDEQVGRRYEVLEADGSHWLRS
jgi:hypothetical protein